MTETEVLKEAERLGLDPEHTRKGMGILGVAGIVALINWIKQHHKSNAPQSVKALLQEMNNKS